MELKTIGMLAVIAIYLIMMVVIGVIYSKNNNDVSDSDGGRVRLHFLERTVGH